MFPRLGSLSLLLAWLAIVPAFGFADPKEDRNGDPLPEGATARLGSTRLRHDHTVTSVSYSKDGKAMISAGWDATLRVWDADSGRELHRFSGKTDGDVRTERMAVSPDLKVLARAGLDKSLTLTEVPSGKTIARIDDLTERVQDLRFSPDGKVLTALDKGKVRRWDAASGKERPAWIPSKMRFRTFLQSPDGKVVALIADPPAQAEREVHLRDAETGRELHRLKGHKNPVFFLAFSPDGRSLASGCADDSIRLWDVREGREIREFPMPDCWVKPLDFSPDGRTLASGGQDGAIRLFEVATGRESRRISLENPGEFVMAVAFSPDGKSIAAGTHEKLIRRWDVDSGRELRPHDGHSGTITAAAYTPDGRNIVTAGEDGFICLWDPATARLRRRWSGGAGRITSLSVSPDGGALATAGGDKDVRIWETDSGREILRIKGSGGEIDSLVFAPDGRTLASAGGTSHAIYLWELKSGRPVRMIDLPSVVDGDFPLAFSPDGRTLASGAGDRTNSVIYLWDVASGREIARLQGAPNPRRLTFSPDGRMLASAHQGGVLRLWETASGALRDEIQEPDASVGSLAFSADGNFLAWGGKGDDAHIRLVHLSTGRTVKRFMGHTHHPLGDHSVVNALAFSPDGGTLLSGGEEGTALLWDVSDRASLVRDAKEEPEVEKLGELWENLIAADARVAYRAIRLLTASPRRSVPFLADKLREAPRADVRSMGRLITELGADSYAVRERATRSIEGLGAQAEPALLKAKSGRLSAEARQRVEVLLETLRRPAASPERLRTIRATEVLERIGSPEARQVLEGGGRSKPESGGSP